MPKNFRDLMNVDITHNGFTLHTRDAVDTSNNIAIIFKQRTGWFQTPKPIHIYDLKSAYKILCPGMERHFPGVVDKIFQKEIIRHLYPIDSQGMVHFL